MSSSKNILLSGYYGFGNTGDEAILESICQELRRQEPEVELSVLMDNKERAQELGVKAYPRRHLAQILLAMRSCSLFISGGGGLLQDSTGPFNVLYYAGLVALARCLGRPGVMFCQGYGPVRTKIGRYCAKMLVPSASLAIMRDPDSVEEVRAVAPKLNVRQTADPALMLTPAPREQVLERLKSCGFTYDESDNWVAVAVRDWPGALMGEIGAALVSFAKSAEEQGDKIKYLLVPFQYAKDVDPSRELYQLLKKAGLEACMVGQLKPRHVLGVLSLCRMVVAMRLHALIFASSLCLPSVGISYDPKVRRFCESVEGVCLDLNALSAVNLHKELWNCWRVRLERGERLQQIVPIMRSSVQGAVTMVLNLAGGISPANV